MAGVELATAYVSLIVEGSKVAPGVKQSLAGVDSEAARTGDRAGRTFSSKFGGALKIGASLAAGFAAVKGVQFLGDAIAEAREASVVTARTSNVIKSMGGVANVTADQVADLAGAISSKVGIDDEAIQSGQNLLLTFKNIRDEAGKGNDIFSQTTGLMVDMSAAMDQDMKSSAVQLGKALNDPVKGVTALQRVGVSFTQQQKDQIKTLVETNDTLGAQKIILGEVKRQFGGAAEAMSTPADRARVAWNNLKEQIGTELLPVVNDVSAWFADEGIPKVSKFIRQFQKGTGTAGEIKDTLGSVADVVEKAAGYAGDMVSAFNDMPDWAKKVMVGGGLAAFALPKIPGGKAGAGLLGKAVGGGVQKVFETNPAALGKGVGGDVPGGSGSKTKWLGAVGGVAGIAAVASAAAGVATFGIFKLQEKVAPKAYDQGIVGTPSPNSNIRMEDFDFFGDKAKGSAKNLMDFVRQAVTGFDDLKGAVGGYDAEIAKTIRRNPAEGFERLRQISRLTGASMEDLKAVLPKTGRQIDAAGGKAVITSKKVHDWALNVLGLNRETNKVDGKKPTVSFKLPGLIPGIRDTITLGGKADNVNKKKPTVSFKFPGLLAGIFDALRLDRALDEAAKDRTSRITVIYDRQGSAHAGGGREAPRASGGPVVAGRTYLVGERGVEVFQPRMSGRIIPHHELASAGAGGGRYALTITNWATGEGYIESVAQGVIRSNRDIGAMVGRAGGGR